jgi:hypothetical protein
VRPHRRNSRNQPAPRASLLMLAALTLSLALGACAPGSAPAASGPQDDAHEEDTDQGDPVLAFFQCLRDGGLDVADPGPGQPAGGLRGQVDMDDSAVTAVIDECRMTHFADTGGRVTVGEGNMGDNLADTAALIAFVDCMREQGIDMPDPGPDGRIGLPDNHDPESSEFQAATRECAQHLSGGGILIGEPGGEGGMTTRGRP